MEALALATVLFLAALLVFPRLGNHLLWQDEAQTALIAETVMQHGLPLGYDGKNYFSMEAGGDYGYHYLWKCHPWLQFYVTAASFELFGIGTFSARLPFAIFGIGTMLLGFLLAKELSGSGRAGLLSCALMAGSVPFLLLCRQCRYYTIASFFAVLGLYAHRRLIGGWRWSIPLLVFSMSLLFYAHYLYYAIFLATFFSHLALFHRSFLKGGIKAFVWTLIFTLPGILWHRTFGYGTRYVLGYRDFGQALGMLVWMLRDLFRYVFPPVLIALMLAALLVGLPAGSKRFAKFRPKYEAWTVLLLWMIWNLTALSLCSAEYYFRYLAPAIPLLCIAAGWAIDGMLRLNRALGALGLALYMYNQPFPDYLYELTHDYVGPINGYVKYLNEHAKPTDVVWATLEDLPLKFYTNLRVVGGMTGEDLSKVPLPDWLILSRFAVMDYDVAARAYIKQHLPRKSFEAIRLPYPDIAFEDREDPEHHKYRTVKGAPMIILFRRIAPFKRVK